MTGAIPGPLRAAAGLAAVAIDEARRLPNRLVALPVYAVSSALQTTLKVRQHYAELVDRGDALLAELRSDTADSDTDGGEPAWATFDEDDDVFAGTEAGDPPTAADLQHPPEPAAPVAPVPGYDDLSLPSLRARLRSLTVTELGALLVYENAHASRPAYVTMLQNRIDTVTS